MDIVERLRNLVAFKSSMGFDEFIEAADTIERLRDFTKTKELEYIIAKQNVKIERLRGALREIACDCDECCNKGMLGCDSWIARAALKETE